MKAGRIKQWAAGQSPQWHCRSSPMHRPSRRPTDTGCRRPSRWQLNMGEGVTAQSMNAYSAHMLALWICVAIGILVFGAMAVAMFKFRHSKGAVAGQGLHPQHQARDHLDRGPGRAAGADGVPGHQQADRDVRHPRRRDDRQGHRLPVDVEVRLPRRRRDASPAASTARATRSARAASTRDRSRTIRTTCSTSTTPWCCRPTPRSAS